MQYLKSFNPVISYDFDGCLHLSVDSYGNPLSFYEPEKWQPNLPMIKQLLKELKDHRIIIVTARDEGDQEYLQQFLDKHDIPVSEIYCTNNGSKVPILKKMKAIKHYDDNPRVALDVQTNSNIEFSYPIY